MRAHGDNMDIYLYGYLLRLHCHDIIHVDNSQAIYDCALFASPPSVSLMDVPYVAAAARMTATLVV